KLAGAGKYVRQQIDKRFKADPDVKEFMKRTGMFTPGVYEIPEARDIMPSHLVRSGDTSAYDVNFGYKAGAAGVILLLNGKAGNTVVNVENSNISYMPTTEAIKRREVDTSEVALFEELGICFGRKPAKYEYKLVEVKGTVPRHV
ncbi:MAG: 6-phosphofructokinase, partial [Nitrospirae bacterium]|nr:6-phosphofructokinase [Nitrospirota bacterium]